MSLFAHENNEKLHEKVYSKHIQGDWNIHEKRSNINLIKERTSVREERERKRAKKRIMYLISFLVN